MLNVGDVGDAIIHFFITPPSLDVKNSIHGALFDAPSPEIVDNVNNALWHAPTSQDVTTINGKLEHFITDSLVQNFTQLFLHTPNVLAENPTILTLYYFFLKVILVATIAGIVYFGIMQIMNKSSKYQTTEYIVKMAQSLVIINIAIRILPILIEATNKFTIVILSLGGSEADMIKTLTPQYGLGLIIFTFIFALILVNLIWYYFMRMISIMFLVATSPIFFYLCLFPKHQNMMQVWIDELLDNLIAPIIHAVIMVIWLGFESSISKSSHGETYHIMLCIAAGSFMLKAPSYVQQWISYGHQSPNPVQMFREIKYGLSPRKLIGYGGFGRMGGSMFRGKGTNSIRRR
jgi:cell shape-determining protein MreD